MAWLRWLAACLFARLPGGKQVASNVQPVLPRADAGQDPNLTRSTKSFRTSNLCLIIYCNIAFTSAAVYRNIILSI
jgi:hypothetical protein